MHDHGATLSISVQVGTADDAPSMEYTTTMSVANAAGLMTVLSMHHSKQSEQPVSSEYQCSTWSQLQHRSSSSIVLLVALHATS